MVDIFSVKIQMLPGTKGLSSSSWQKDEIGTKEEENGPNPHGEKDFKGQVKEEF